MPRAWLAFLWVSAACGGDVGAGLCDLQPGEAPLLAGACTPDVPATSGRALPAPRGDPTAAEQLMLELLNRVRLDPAGEAEALGFALDEGTDPPLCAYPRPPLTMNPVLLAVARAHSRNMLARGFFGHDDPDGASPADRVAAAGYEYSVVAENLARFSADETLPLGRSTREAHAGLFADGCCEGRGHRVNMLLDDVCEAGVGIQQGRTEDGGESRQAIAFTQDLATSMMGPVAFIVGVVFQDADGDGRYGPSEGVGGVTVSALGWESQETVTDATGGYAFAVPDGGVFLLEFSGPIDHRCALVESDGRSRKVDVMLP